MKLFRHSKTPGLSVLVNSTTSEDTWIECLDKFHNIHLVVDLLIFFHLGDPGRYRMAIEDDEPILTPYGTDGSYHSSQQTMLARTVSFIDEMSRCLAHLLPPLHSSLLRWGICISIKAAAVYCLLSTRSPKSLSYLALAHDLEEFADFASLFSPSLADLLDSGCR